MRASSKRPRVESSSGVAPPPSPSLGDPTAEEFVDPTVVAAAPPPSSYVGHYHDRSGGSWSAFGGRAHEASGFACSFGEL